MGHSALNAVAMVPISTGGGLIVVMRNEGTAGSQKARGVLLAGELKPSQAAGRCLRCESPPSARTAALRRCRVHLRAPASAPAVVPNLPDTPDPAHHPPTIRLPILRAHG